MVEMLIEHEADVSAPDGVQNTPLHYGPVVVVVVCGL